LTVESATGGANLRFTGQRSRSLGTKCKNHWSISSQNCGSIFIKPKPKPKWSLAYSTHMVEYISPAKMCHFRDIFLFVCHIPFVSSRRTGKL